MQNESTETAQSGACSNGITAGMLRRLHFDQEPGRGYTKEMLHEHVTECDACQRGMSLVARSDQQARASFEAFQERLKKLAEQAKDSRVEDVEALRQHLDRGEKVRVSVQERVSTLEEDAALPMWLTVADTKRKLQELRTGKADEAEVIRSLVGTLNRLIGLSNDARQEMMEALAIVCRQALRDLSADLMAVSPPFARFRPGAPLSERSQVYRLDQKEALPIALAVASDSEVLNRAREPFMDVKLGNELVVDPTAYMRAAASGQGG